MVSGPHLNIDVKSHRQCQYTTAWRREASPFNHLLEPLMRERESAV
jgi:hypothetical protein